MLPGVGHYLPAGVFPQIAEEIRVLTRQAGLPARS
jgi:hypothetical protein